MATGNMTVEITEAQPPKGGILEVLGSVGRVHPVSDPHLGQGVVFETIVCGTAALAPGLCDDALGLAPEAEKVFSTPGAGEALAFGVYKGIECTPFYRDYKAKAVHALELGESYAVEQAISALHFATADEYNAGVAHSVTRALGIAEHILATTASGGMISVSRGGAAFLGESRNVKGENGMLETIQGSRIINGAGFQEAGPTGAAALTGEQFYIFVHGAMDLYAGPVIYNQGQDLSTNTERGVAERLYSSTVQCQVTAILVDPSL